MLPFKLIYHPGYDLNLGAHVFPSQKYWLIRDRLLRKGWAALEDFEEPEAAADEQVLLVHDAGWVERLKHGQLRYAELLKLEIPWTKRTAEAYWLAAGGTILAAERALRDRVAVNIGGGFHHAFREHGEGFCALNDIAIAIRTLQARGSIQRAMVVDCDVHHGNGTAAIFANDATVFTLSIHQLDNYPSEKPPSSLDIDLPDLVGDADYLRLLRLPCEQALEAVKPDLVIYVAGADPYQEDQLGGLALTLDGLKKRDEMMLEAALSRGAAVAVVLAGGYAENVDDTVTIHCNTILAANGALSKAHTLNP